MAKPTQLNKKGNFGHLVIDHAENTYWIQNIQMPSISIHAQKLGHKALGFQMEGKLEFGNVTMTFKVDEGLNNYFELFDWMIKLGATPEELTPNIYATMNSAACDMRFVALDNDKNPIRTICFVDSFPVELSGLEYDTKNASDNQTCNVTFAFSYMQLDK